MGGAGAGKGTAIDAVQKRFNESGERKVSAPISFLLSAKNEDGSSVRDVRKADNEGENNRIWISPEILKMMELNGIVLTNTAIDKGGWENGGYNYITATEFGKNDKEAEIWQKIAELPENKKNPAFHKIEDKTLALKNVVDSGDVVFLEGHAVGWYNELTEKLTKIGLPMIGLGWIGMSEQTSFERQTVSRGDANLADEVKKQKAIELAKSKAQDAMVQQAEILKHRDNTKKDPSLPPFYTFGAIGRSKKEMVDGILRDKNSEQIKADIAEFTKTRANYIFELANRQHNFNVARFNFEKTEKQYEISPSPENKKLLNLAEKNLKDAEVDFNSLGEYGVEGWNEIRNSKNGQEKKNEKLDKDTGLNSYNEELLYFEQNSENKSDEIRIFLQKPENQLNLRMINARKEFEKAKQQKQELTQNNQNLIPEKSKHKKLLESTKEMSNAEFINFYLTKTTGNEKFSKFVEVIIARIKRENKENSSDNSPLFEKLRELKSFAELKNNFTQNSENSLSGISSKNQEIIGSALRQIFEIIVEKENQEKSTENSEMRKSKRRIA